jgi:hypothetical protein
MQARPNDAWKIQVADFDRRLQQYLQRPVWPSMEENEESLSPED